MGGDADPNAVATLASFMKEKFPSTKVGWYSGKDQLPEFFSLKNFDYVKIGSYREECGPLKSRTTNQRLYKINDGKNLQDITEKFWR